MELLVAHYLPYLAAATFLFLIPFLLKKIITKSSVEPPLPPGPWKLPIIGSMHHLSGGLPHHVLGELARQHGPLVLLKLGQVHLAVASSREAAEEIMKTQDVNFATRPQLNFFTIVAYGGNNNLSLTPYGPFWKQLRKIAAMELLSTKRVKSFADVRGEEIHNMMKNISSDAGRSKPINLSKMLLLVSNSVLSRAAFGKKCEQQDRILQLVKEGVSLLSGFDAADFFPSMKFLGVLSGVRPRLERIHRQFDEIFDDIIQRHQLKRARKVTTPSDEEEDLVDVLLRIKDQGDLEYPITMINIKAMLLELLFGGTETSAVVVEWTMSELIRNPAVMAKAQKEVREALKGKTKVEESDVAGLNYLKLVVKETLRLHPPGPLLFPRMSKETVEVLGYKIPAGTRVMINMWAMGRDPQYWEDPESYKPERFDGSKLDFRGFNFEFVPFGAGRRICPGMTFALATVDMVLAQLLLYFDWKLPNGMKPEELDMSEMFAASSGRAKNLELLAIPRIPLLA